MRELLITIKMLVLFEQNMSNKEQVLELLDYLIIHARCDVFKDIA